MRHGLETYSLVALASFCLVGCPQPNACPPPNYTWNGLCVTDCHNVPGSVCYPDGAVIGPRDGASDALDVTDSAPDVVDVSIDAADSRNCTMCGSACVSLQDDAMNCGACGNVCPGAVNGTPACVMGACTLSCMTGYEPASGACRIRVPRPIAPMSTSRVTSHTPMLRWELPPGVDAAHVEICPRRECTTVFARMDVSGTSSTTVALSPGHWFWRLTGRVGGAMGDRTSPTWEFFVGAENASVNTAGGSVLDVNGDGVADVAVGAIAANSNAGAAYVYYGGSSIHTTPDVTIGSPDGAGHRFGAGIASAGDVDGDGYGDLLVGALGDTASIQPRVYLFLGGPSGVSSMTPSRTFDPPAPSANFGSTLASAGDINRDGYGDLIVSGSPAQLYLGGPHGPATMPMTSVPPVGSSLGAGSGAFVGSAGDANGDGFADVAVTAVVGSTSSVAVFYGGTAGLGAMPTILTSPEPGPYAAGYRPIAGAGDVDGDGYADVVFSTDGWNTHQGRAWGFRGSGAGVSTMASFDVAGPDGQSSFGHDIAIAGDVNSDGFDDVIVGAYTYSGGTQVGRAYLFEGSAGGLPSSATLMVDGPDGAGGGFSFGVAGLGDVSGDGGDDVGIGAFGAGRAYVYFGMFGGIRSVPSLELDAPTSASRFGETLALERNLRSIRALLATEDTCASRLVPRRF